MKGLVAWMVVLFAVTSTAQAHFRLVPHKHRAKVEVTKSPVQKEAVQKEAVQKSPQQTATQKAEQKAAWGHKGHIGGGFGGANAEGVGFSSASAQAALNNCCFTGRRACVGSAVVRGRDGWYAVKLFR